MELSKKKFEEALLYLKKEKKITKNTVAKELGYKSVNNLSMITKGNNQLTLDIVDRFCKLYPRFTIQDFYEETDEQFEEASFKIDTVSSRLITIENQIDVIHKTNKMMKQIFLSGIELSDAQYKNVNQLRNLIGS